MVFAGQDAWRKHPMLTGCYKRPFPGLGIALGLFAGYCVLDGTIKFATAPTKDLYGPEAFKFEAQVEDDE
ncbi:unnamed protein product [Ectocarpus sp. CCAP 1310/34]|nr:unnamed protein product [Ectocarpus sp. CCAP 1310/34]